MDLAAELDDAVSHADDGYHPPGWGQAEQLAAAWRLVLLGHLSQAERLAEPLGYDVVAGRDVTTGEPIVLLAEDRHADRTHRGWGLYVFAPRSPSALVVEVAHPVADAYTHEQGLEAFRASRGRALLVAGAHRDAAEEGGADVAHQPDTPFHRIHEATVEATSIVYQPHGYANRTSPRHDVVVSTGSDPTPLAEAVTAALEGAFFKVCLYDGRACRRLAATTNVQGVHTRDLPGAQFLHVETSRRVRDDKELRLQVARIIADAAELGDG